ncbi:MAG TPA: DUF2268 domain-containing putative Zn-dependent protease [Longimicrobiales bacterium]|nr:DUF2268 domain-containing putative Zn-dependent protease [Longimicrobiales bacterium]
MDSLSPVLDEVYAGFDALHALANDPSVYLVVGTGISAGSTTGGRHPMILLGMERHGSVAGLPWTIAHELVHTQQDHPRLGSLTGGPRLLRGTLLRHAIVEGAADFIAELVTGRPVVNPFGEANEAMLREEFLRDAPGKEYGKWLYNGGRDRPEGWPADLGYWIGYRIVKAYYDGSADKAAALDRILTIDDFKAFLEDSGYAGS